MNYSRVAFLIFCGVIFSAKCMEHNERPFDKASEAARARYQQEEKVQADKRRVPNLDIE